eukprot:gene39387-48676_t
MNPKYKRNVSNTVLVAVAGSLMDASGVEQPFKFSLICTRLPATEQRAKLDALAVADIPKFFAPLTTGWRDQTLVTELDGSPAEFCPEALEELFDIAGVAQRRESKKLADFARCAALGLMANEAEQLREDREVDAALAMWGLVADRSQVALLDVYLWPCNVPSWDLFQRLQSQWLVGMSGAVGLNYSGVESAMRLMDIKKGKRAKFFADIQVMERATLAAWEERRNKESPDQAIAEFNRLRAEGSASLSQLASQGGRALNNLGMSAAQHAQALRMIPAQVTDIVVSLQAGQAPLTVLLQQGGQLRDMFGSSGAAARALGTYVVGLVNPYTVAAAAGLALALAYNQGSKEADGYRKSIELTGGAAGASADQMADMAREIGAVVGTQAAASEAVAALAGTGQVAVENLKAFSEQAIRSERAIGKSIADTAADFADLGKAPLRASEKLNEQYHYLTASVYAQIRALEEQGKMDEAGAVAQKAYADAMGDRSARLIENLGTIEKAWTSVTDLAKRGWDAMLDVGRSDTLEEKLADAEATLAKAQRNRSTFAGGGADGKADLDNAQKAVAALKEQRDAQAWNAKVRAEGIKLEEASMAWLKDGVQYLSKKARLEQDIVAIREKGLAAGVAEADINERIVQVRKKYSELNNSGIAALEAKRGRRASISGRACSAA